MTKIRFAAAAAVVLGLAGCENALLEYNDPDIITQATSAAGAVALKNGTIGRFTSMTSGDESLFLLGGLLVDEFRSSDTFEQRNTTDQRDINATNSFLDDIELDLNRVRHQGKLAIEALKQYRPDPSADIGLMYALGAYAENLAGEHYCNGMVFSEIVDGVETPGSPIPVTEAFNKAIASADLALQNVGGTGGSTVTSLAQIVKGRALLNLNQHTAAAAAVAAVPTSFQYLVGHSANTSSNQIWALNNSARRYSIPNAEGGNGMNWFSANDPRVKVTNRNRLGFDSQTPFFDQGIWGQYDAVAVATGIEARLIEAEALLKANDVNGWLAKLNAARATRAGLAPLADPGNATARVDLMFRERAFWMFGTGHRVGDLRRLVRQYGRASNTVYPEGEWHKGGVYGETLNVPVSVTEKNNPNVPQQPGTDTKYGSSCIDRAA